MGNSRGSWLNRCRSTAAWLAMMSNDLGYYNATHIHNQIYMDVNYDMVYSMHVLA